MIIVKVKENFTCPDCGHHEIEEIMDDVVVSSSVETLAVNKDGDYPDVEYGKMEADGGVVDRYQCKVCGWTLPHIGSPDQLMEYLHNYRS